MRNKFYCYCVIMLLTSCRGQEHDSLAFNPPVFPETKQISVTPLPNDFVFDQVGTTMEDIGDFIVIGKPPIKYPL